MSGGSPGELYVYYRVAQEHAQAAVQTVLTFQQQLREQHPGLTTRVLRRAAEPSDGVTLMEIYAFDDGRHTGIGTALHARIDEAAAPLLPLLSGPRRAEAFDALD